MLAKDPTSEECADVIAINQLAHAYAHAISRGRHEEAAQTYCHGGSLTTPVLAPTVGRAAIEAAIHEGTKGLAMVFHVVQNSVIEVRGDRADACFQVSEWAKRKSDGAVFLYLGFYDDELVRLPEGWRFWKRTLVSRALARADIDIKQVYPDTGLRSSFG